MNATGFDTALWTYRARMVRLRDADTVVLLVDCGYRSRHEEAVRLAGVDAPERGTAAGVAAMEWLSDFLVARGAWSTGSWRLRVRTLRKETVQAEETSFDRWVSDLWVVEEGGEMVDVGGALVAAGHGVKVGAA